MLLVEIIFSFSKILYNGIFVKDLVHKKLLEEDSFGTINKTVGSTFEDFIPEGQIYHELYIAGQTGRVISSARNKQTSIKRTSEEAKKCRLHPNRTRIY